MKAVNTFTGGMVSDLALNTVPQDKYLDGKNIRVGIGDKENAVEAIKSFLRLTPTRDTNGDNKIVGAVEDKERDRVFALQWNSLGRHQLLVAEKRGDGQSTLVNTIIESPNLELSENVMVHSMYVVNNYVGWVDGLFRDGEVIGTEPKLVDVEKARLYTNDSIKQIKSKIIFEKNDTEAYIDGTIITLNIHDINTGVVIQQLQSVLSGAQGDYEIVLGEFQNLVDAHGGSWEVVNGSLEIEAPFGVFYTAESNQVAELYSVFMNRLPHDAPDYCFTLKRLQPDTAPIVRYVSDDSYESKMVSYNAYKFAYRYVFYDNSRSPFSPLSDVPVNFKNHDLRNLPTGFQPLFDIWEEVGVDERLNAIEVSIRRDRHYDPDFMWQVKGVELCVVQEGDGLYRLWQYVPIEDLGVSTQLFNFYNEDINAPISSDDQLIEGSQSIKVQDYVPKAVAAAELISDERGNTHLILCGTREGYDSDIVDARWRFQFRDFDGGQVRTYKQGSKRKAYLQYEDKFGRKGPLLPLPDLDVPRFVSEVQVDGSPVQYAKPLLGLAHIPPIWAHNYRVYLGQDQAFSNYRQSLCTFDYIDGAITEDANSGFIKQFMYNGESISDDLVNQPTRLAQVLGIALPGQDNTDEVNFIDFNRSEGLYLLPEDTDFVRLLGAARISTNPLAVGDKSAIATFPTLANINAHPAINDLDRIFRTDIPVFGYYVDPDDGLVYALIKIDIDFGLFESLDTLPGRAWWVEYKRRSRSDSSLFYEAPYTGVVENPGTPQRIHSGAFNSGYIEDIIEGGDAAWRVTLNFPVTNVIYTESAIQGQDSQLVKALGRPAIYDSTESDATYKGRFRHSRTYNQNTKTNGLISFDSGLPLDTNQRFGGATKLVFTGSTLVAILSNKILPIYVGRSRLLELGGTQSVGVSNQLLNTGEETKMDVGSINPESIAYADGRIYGWDAQRSVVWRFAQDGVRIISDYDNSVRFQDIARDRRPVSIYDQTVVGGIDKRHNIYYLGFTTDVYGEGDFTSVVLERLIGFQDNDRVQTNASGWTCEYDFHSEYFCQWGDEFISFKNGDYWLHDEGDGYNNFFGVDYKSTIKFVFNKDGLIPKQPLSIEVVSNPELWYCKEITVMPTAKYPNGQRSRIRPAKFVSLRGRYYADFLRDMDDLSERAGTTLTERLLRGRVLEGEAIIIELELDGSNSPLTAVVTNYINSNL